MTNPLRVELTLFEPRLFREKALWVERARPRLLYCSRYEDAVSPPFPAEGKRGLSIWAGPLAAFKDPKARLLWELEKRRKRPTIVVLTAQKGRSFMRAYREVSSLLADTALVPTSFLRKRGKGWDSLDFFSPGDSSFMEGANPRLKRLKQMGWEYLVDGVCQTDPVAKAEYFESLRFPRESLIAGLTSGLRQLRLSPVVGIAGEGLNQESLFSLLDEPMLDRIVEQVKGQSPPPQGEWLLLAHSNAGAELSLLGNGVEELKVGSILSGVTSAKGKAEFAVSEIAQIGYPAGEGGKTSPFCRVKVDWRYPPDREIPTRWVQKNASLAGSDPAGG